MKTLSAKDLLCAAALLVSLILLPATLSAQEEGKDQKERQELEEMFPDMRFCTPVFDYPVYHADDLWDYIDGAADNYLNYKFVDLHIAEYTKARGKVLFKVEVYRHASPLYAFGIYSSERSPDYHFIDLGTQGFRESGQIFFLKGPYYVKVISMQEGSKDEEKSLYTLASLMEQHLEGTTEFPPELSLFPDEGKIENSERFIASDFLGHAFFDSVFTADYRIGENAFTMFLSKRADEASAKNILEKMDKEKKIEKPLKEGDYKIDDGYNGTLYLIWTKNVVFGFQNVKDYTQIINLAAEVLTRL